MFFYQYFNFPLSVSFHHCSILIHSSTTHGGACYVSNRTCTLTANVKFTPGQHTKYKVADKFLARPGRKQAKFPASYGICRFITAFTTAQHLSLPWTNESIPLPITFLTFAACFLPGRAKDLSAPRYKVHQ